MKKPEMPQRENTRTLGNSISGIIGWALVSYFLFGAIIVYTLMKENELLGGALLIIVPVISGILIQSKRNKKFNAKIDEIYETEMQEYEKALADFEAQLTPEMRETIAKIPELERKASGNGYDSHIVAEAAYELWQIYLFGRDGNESDERKANKYLHIASENGHTEASYRMAQYYINIGLQRSAKDYLETYFLFAKEDDEYYASAEYSMAVVCWNDYINEKERNANSWFPGEFDASSKMESYKWAKRAAQKGHETAAAFIATHF